MPWKVLKMVKRYAKTTDDSLMKNNPNDQVRPKRHSRAKPPMTHDLREQIKEKQRGMREGRRNHYSVTATTSAIQYKSNTASENHLD